MLSVSLKYHKQVFPYKHMCMHLSIYMCVRARARVCKEHLTALRIACSTVLKILTKNKGLYERITEIINSEK